MEQATARSSFDPSLSLYQLLDDKVLADPYPLFKQLRETDPVHWDPYFHSWVVTRYEDVVNVMLKCSADRNATPHTLETLGMVEELQPIEQVIVKQILFMDPPIHARRMALCGFAFPPARVAGLKDHIAGVANQLIDEACQSGQMEVMADFANPLPAIVTAELFGVPEDDHAQWQEWCTDFAAMLGNFQHNPDRARRVLESANNLVRYFKRAIRNQAENFRAGLVTSLVHAKVDGARLTEEEVVANLIVTLVEGQETTSNLIGNGLASLLRNPDQLELLRNDWSILPAAIEELLRYESPSQYTVRVAPEDMTLGGKSIRKKQAIIAVFAAANRDPERFEEPDRLDLRRTNNRHLAFAWGSYDCLGAPLARMEGEIAIETLLKRIPNIRLGQGELAWRENLGLRGLKSLSIRFDRG